MKRLHFLALCLLFVSPVFSAQAKDVPLDAVIAALESPFKSSTDSTQAIADFEALFFQESRIASLDRIQSGEGKVMIKFDRSTAGQNPKALFRWEYTRPTTQEFVSNGKTIWVYIPENRQVIESDIEATAESRPDDPLTFLTGLGNLSRDFIIRWAEPRTDAEGNFILELQPRRPSPMIESMRLVVVQEAVLAHEQNGGLGKFFPLRSSTVVDPSGNSTNIEFREVKMNRSLADHLFTFEVPQGVEVLRPTSSTMGY